MKVTRGAILGVFHEWAETCDPTAGAHFESQFEDGDDEDREGRGG